jgi:hypothetical protein
MRRFRCAALAAVFLGVQATAAVAGPPTQLFNKSIVVNWAEDRTMEHTNGKVYKTVIHAQMAFYVSSAGRVFTQSGRTRIMARGTSTMSSGASRGPDGEVIRTANSRYATNLLWEGRTVRERTKYESGARELTITFDEAFRSCSLSIVWGKEGGMPGIIKTGMHRELYVLRAVSMASPSCVIREGNVFGG